jgi:hypothetical protein
MRWPGCAVSTGSETIGQGHHGDDGVVAAPFCEGPRGGGGSPEAAGGGRAHGGIGDDGEAVLQRWWEAVTHTGEFVVRSRPPVVKKLQRKTLEEGCFTADDGEERRR